MQALVDHSFKIGQEFENWYDVIYTLFCSCTRLSALIDASDQIDAASESLDSLAAGNFNQTGLQAAGRYGIFPRGAAL